MKHAGGRPTKYTKELGSKLCSELSQGKSLRTVCNNNDEYPSVATVFNWFQKHPEFLEQYERAKEESADSMSDEMLDIADSVSIAEVQKARLRVDTRKWLASKLKPKKYGDKIDHTTDGKPITVQFAPVFNKDVSTTQKTSGDNK